MIRFFQRYQTQLAVGMWALLLGIVLSSVLSGNHRSVTDAYAHAATAWLGGESMYSGDGTGFIYLPQAAILYIPFNLLPGYWGDVFWRIVSIGAFGLAIARWSELGQGVLWKGGEPRKLFPLLTLVSIPLAFSASRNGQSTILMMALMILSAMEMNKQRWWNASGLLALCFALKPLSIVMILLSAALYPAMAVRFAILLPSVLVAPFLFQHPGYVHEQYVACVDQLQISSELGHTRYWAQFFGMFKVTGIQIPPFFQTVLRLALAVGTLWICWVAKRRMPPGRFSLLLYSFSVCYLMLFNPRTENNTYAMMGPVLGVFLVYEAFQTSRTRYAVALGVCALCTVGSYEFGKLVTPPEKCVWLAPLVCTAFSIYLAANVLRKNGLAFRPLDGAVNQTLK